MSKNPRVRSAQSDYDQTSERRQPYSSDYDETRSYGFGARNQNLQDYDEENPQRNRSERYDYYDPNYSGQSSMRSFDPYQNRRPSNYRGSNERYASQQWDDYGYDRYSSSSDREGRFENFGRRGPQDYQRFQGNNPYDERNHELYGRPGNRSEERSSYDNRRTWDEGEFRGKGPKGYKRSDDRIQEDVNDTLTDNGMIDASEIEVSVQNGEVTLTGTVSSKRDKRLSEDLAESVSGVNNVENKLKVKRNWNEQEEEYSAKNSLGEQRKKRQQSETLN